MSDEVESQVPGQAGGRQARLALVNLAQAAAQGDGNADGVPDSQQANVVSLPGAAGKWLTFAAASTVAFKDVVPIIPQRLGQLPVGYSFPVGAVSLSLTGFVAGGTVAVTNILHDSVALSTVFAYGPTPGQPVPHWHQLNPAFVGREIRLNFTDGAAGDRDLSANGVITTIYAPAYLVPSGPALTLLSHETHLINRLGVISVNGVPTLVTNQAPVIASVLAWPASATNWSLQFTDDLSPTNFWRPVFDVPIVRNNQNVVTNTAVVPTRFYRLRRF